MREMVIHRFRLMLVALLGLMLVGAFSAPRVARAIEFDDDGIIAADEVIDDDVIINHKNVVVDGAVIGDLFASGGSVTINGKVNGNLLVAGGDVVINGMVNGSLAFAGKTLLLNGTVRGTVYATGGSFTLGESASVGRNVFCNGFSMEAEPGSAIGRDALVSGYQALLDGQMEGDVQAEVAALEIGGVIGGDVMAKVPEPGSGPRGGFSWPGVAEAVNSGLRVAKGARIDGTLTYVSPVEQADAIEAIPGGGVVYELPDDLEVRIDLGWRAGQWFLARGREFITLLVLGALAIWRLPVLLNRLADQAKAQPLPAAGRGLVVLIVGYVGAAVLAALILILGILLGVVTLGELARAIFGVGFSGLMLALTLLWLCSAYGSKLVVAYLAGKLVLERIAPQSVSQAIWPLLLGVVLYVLLRSIPVLGWLVGLLATFVGLGAMWLLFREARSVARPTLDQEVGVD